MADGWSDYNLWCFGKPNDGFIRRLNDQEILTPGHENVCLQGNNEPLKDEYEKL